jgi:proteic killer suppression protein
MIHSFRDQAAEDIFNGVNSSAARRACPQQLWRIAARKLDQLDSVEALEELRVPTGNRPEALKGDGQGQYIIRLNEQYRICFVWRENSANDVEIIDYH